MVLNCAPTNVLFAPLSTPVADKRAEPREHTGHAAARRLPGVLKDQSGQSPVQQVRARCTLSFPLSISLLAEVVLVGCLSSLWYHIPVQ